MIAHTILICILQMNIGIELIFNVINSVYIFSQIVQVFYPFLNWVTLSS